MHMHAQVAMKTGAPYYLGRLIRIPSNLSKSKPSLKWPLGWKGVVVHGGGGTVYRESHPLVRHLTENYCSEGVYSVELPSHGRCASDHLISSHQARDNIFNLVNPLIDSHTIVVGYSVGGMIMSSLWRSLCYILRLKPMGIFIGCHPRVVVRTSGIGMFWSVPYTYLSLRHKSLQQIHTGDEGEGHQEYWKTTVNNTRDWLLDSNSALNASDQSLQFLTSSESMTNWIIGDKDTPFPSEYFAKSISQKTITGGMEQVMRIHSTHFNYFSKNWPHTRLAIDQVLKGFSSSEAEYIR